MRKGFVEGDERAVIAGRRGGIVRGKQLSAARLQAWAEKFPAVPTDAARAIYLCGYQAGAASKYQQRRKRI